MSTGLFGGTFNPIHNGHLGILYHVKKEFNLKKLILFPSAFPPHKSLGNLAPARDRLEMIQGCLMDRDGFEASDIELKRQGPSFTVDTVQSFQARVRDDLFLLMGSDAFFDIHTWKGKDRIFKIIPIIVMIRGDQITTDHFLSFIDENITKGYKIKKNAFVHDRMQGIYICRVPRIDISSTMIRLRIKNNLSIREFVPANVADTILKKDLYK